MPIYSTTPISQLQPIVTLNSLDVLPIVDVSDTTQSLAGSTKKVTYQQLTAGITNTIWNVAPTSQTMAPSSGYLCTGGSLVQLTLPPIANQLTLLEVAGFGAGGWQIMQGVGQQIVFGTASTTLGSGGSLASHNQYDCIRLLCTVANTTWVVLSVQGNVTYI